MQVCALLPASGQAPAVPDSPEWLLSARHSSVVGQSELLRASLGADQATRLCRWQLGTVTTAVTKKATGCPSSGKSSGRGIDFLTAILCLCLKCAKSSF